MFDSRPPCPGRSTSRQARGVGRVSNSCLCIAAGLIAQTAILTTIPDAAVASSSDTATASGIESWDTTLARGRTRTIEFTTDEATFESVDVSPDGRWVVFDLLGHIYRVAISGGSAECLTQSSGAALNYHPRYSPDGGTIAFVSDRSGGQDNLWLMDADGRNPRALFLDRGSRIRQPSWLPDGKTIVAVRVFPTVMDWEFHRTTLAAFPLDGQASHELLSSVDWQYYWPAPTPDGRYLYFYRSTMMRPQDGITARQQIQRLALTSGLVQDVTAPKRELLYSGPDAVELAPEVSPDGQWLAFARRVPDGSVDIRGHRYNVRTALWLRDLHTGAEHVLMDPIESDSTGGNSVRHMKALPGYRWTKDGQSLVVPQGGKIRRVWCASGRVETIPFLATVRREMSESVRSATRVGDGPLDVKFLRSPTSSPDGSRMVFDAVGRLWMMELPNGQPRPLIDEKTSGFQLNPAWSPDGKWIAYVTWDDVERGHVWRVRAHGGTPERLTSEAGEYLSPVWAPDSRSVLVTRGDGATARGEDWNGILNWELIRLSTQSKQSQEITVLDAAVQPSIGAGAIYFPELRTAGDLVAPARRGDFEHVQWIVNSVTNAGKVRRRFVINGSGPAPTPRGDLMASVAVAPHADWVAFVDRFNVYLSPLSFSEDVEPVIGPTGPGVRRLTRQGGLYPTWRNPNTLQFLSGNRYYAYHVDSGRLDIVPISLQVPRESPTGTIALTQARIITLDQRRVIERGTVLIKGNRIVCVGECDISSANRVEDLSGKTIIPGLIDMHAHHLTGVAGIVPRHRHDSARYLVHGVTTVLDPATWADPAFPIAELIDAGEVTGPRTYSVGNAMAGFGGTSDIRSYRDAEDNIARLVSWGAVSIKDYLQPSRVERQMLAQAARRAGVTITAEGEDLFRDLALVIDGHPGWEHNLPYTPLYADAVRFFGKAGIVYSATLNVSSPSLRGQEYHQVHSDLLSDPKQRRFVPWREWGRADYWMTRPLADYAFPILAEGLADIVRAGGYGAIGGHGEWNGLDSHWDLWSGAMALSPMEALEVATWQGASFIGLNQDLGSISVGKVADLVVLNANPLEDIHNTRNIRYVMKGGRLYDGNTLNEIWPASRDYGPRPWAVNTN
jgi:Tol biopolymer transport system component